MALFFDAEWFDKRLSQLGLSRAALASALGLPALEIDEIWKDQRELSASEVGIIATLLDTAAEEISSRAGISTPVPRRAATVPAQDALAEIRERLTRIEIQIAELARYLRSRG